MMGVEIMSSFPVVLQKSLGSDKEVIDMCTLGLSKYSKKIYDLVSISFHFSGII